MAPSGEAVMPPPFIYRCSGCGAGYERDEVIYLCPACSAGFRPGMPLKGVLRVEYDYQVMRRRVEGHDLDWRQWSPVAAEYYPPYPMAETPFSRLPRLEAATGFSQLWAKNDGLLPSGSLKDRASLLVAAEAIRTHASTLVAASTGNAASSLAAVCAAAGLACTIFVPAAAPRAKLVQMLIHGARVIPVNGTYDDAFRLSLEYSERYGGLNRNTAYHPLTIEGKKSAGLEIFFQNGRRVPEVILIPTGDGVILSGIYKAFYDLREAGVSQRLPRLVAIQAERSDAIHRFCLSGIYSDAHDPRTVADSISVSVPSNALMARQAIRESGGFSLTVSDAEILAGQRQLAQLTGIFAEPAAAAVAAGLLKLRGDPRLDPGEQIVLLITGHGLKDTGAVLPGLPIPAAIEPSIDLVTP